MGHPDVHRVLKELVKLDSQLPDGSLEFSSQLAKIMLKNLDQCLKTRAAWIFVEFLEHDNTKKLVFDDLKKESKKISSLLKQSTGKGNKGLEIVSQKIGK